MPKLLANVVLRHPDSGAPVVLLSGAECPAWAANLISNPDLIAPEKPTAKPTPRRSPRKKS